MFHNLLHLQQIVQLNFLKKNQSADMKETNSVLIKQSYKNVIQTTSIAVVKVPDKGLGDPGSSSHLCHWNVLSVILGQTYIVILI